WAAVKLNQHKRVGHTDFISPDSNKAFWTPPATPLRYLGSLSTGATGWCGSSRCRIRWSPSCNERRSQPRRELSADGPRCGKRPLQVGIEITAESEGLAVYPAKVNQTLIWKYKWMRVARDEQPEGDGNMRKKSREEEAATEVRIEALTTNPALGNENFGTCPVVCSTLSASVPIRYKRIPREGIWAEHYKWHVFPRAPHDRPESRDASCGRPEHGGTPHLSRRPPHIGVKLGCQKDRWESHSEVMRAVDAESVSISGPAADKSRNVQVGAAIDESNRSGTFPTARFFTLVEAPIIVHSPVLSEEDNIKCFGILTKPLGVADWSTATIRKNKVPILYWEEYEDLGDFWVLKTCTIVLRDERPVQGLESRRSKREPVFRKFLVPIPVERLVKRRGTWWLVGTRQKTEPSNGALHYTFSLAIIICSTNFIICGSALTSTHQPELTKNVLGALYTAANFLVQSLTAQIEAPIS
ncbi:hypothetical protein B0H19DRAFT_1084071, partial [Mycena capillaripes]